MAAVRSSQTGGGHHQLRDDSEEDSTEGGEEGSTTSSRSPQMLGTRNCGHPADEEDELCNYVSHVN